jgi:hypothetical protein
MARGGRRLLCGAFAAALALACSSAHGARDGLYYATVARAETPVGVRKAARSREVRIVQHRVAENEARANE